jgi:hypothetical protein
MASQLIPKYLLLNATNTHTPTIHGEGEPFSGVRMSSEVTLVGVLLTYCSHSLHEPNHTHMLTLPKMVASCRICPMMAILPLGSPPEELANLYTLTITSSNTSPHAGYLFIRVSSYQ